MPAGVCFYTPNQQNTHMIEMVQRRAARWTMNDYARMTSITLLLHQLGWQTLEERRFVARLCLFYKIVYGLMTVPHPECIQPTHMIFRYCHSMTFCQIHTVKTPINTPSFLWLSFSGMFFQKAPYLRLNWQLLENCSTPSGKP